MRDALNRVEFLTSDVGEQVCRLRGGCLSFFFFREKLTARSLQRRQVRTIGIVLLARAEEVGQ